MRLLAKRIILLAKALMLEIKSLRYIAQRSPSPVGFSGLENGDATVEIATRLHFLLRNVST